MPAIKNIEGLTTAQINQELAYGAKFVMYQYTISVVLMTFKRSSDIYFVRANENCVITGLPFTIMSFVLGWWGFPWGPIYTIGSLYRNLSGGTDITQDVLLLMNGQAAKPAA
ncbi:MAG: hypothetical protein ABIS36_20175 [Chryseolinea sp.]